MQESYGLMQLLALLYINIPFYQWTNASLYTAGYHRKKFRILIRTFCCIFMGYWMFIVYSIIFHKASWVILENHWFHTKNYLAWEIWTFSAITNLCTLRKTVADWIYLKIVWVLFYICHLWTYAINVFLEELMIWVLKCRMFLWTWS